MSSKAVNKLIPFPSVKRPYKRIGKYVAMLLLGYNIYNRRSENDDIDWSDGISLTLMCLIFL